MLRPGNIAAVSAIVLFVLIRLVKVDVPVVLSVVDGDHDEILLIQKNLIRPGEPASLSLFKSFLALSRHLK